MSILPPDKWMVFKFDMPVVAIVLGVPLIFGRFRRSRLFAAISIAVVLGCLGWLVAIDMRLWWPRPVTFFGSCLIALLLRAVWCVAHRERALYVPPPEPPASGGPYR